MKDMNEHIASAARRRADRIGRMAQGYRDCLLWVGVTDENGETVEVTGGLDLPAIVWVGVVADVTYFYYGNFQDLEEFVGLTGWAQAGHDLFLTRNHHGTGFWDRGAGDAGDRLTVAAHELGTDDYFMDVDGSIRRI